MTDARLATIEKDTETLEFTGYSRTLLRELCLEVRRLRAENARLKEVWKTPVTDPPAIPVG